MTFRRAGNRGQPLQYFAARFDPAAMSWGVVPLNARIRPFAGIGPMT